MDDATPSWLEEGPSSPPAASADPSPPPAEPTPSPSFSIDDGNAAPSAAPAAVAEKSTARTAPATDNVAGTMLNSMNDAKAKAEASVAVADESDLPRMILLMRVTNMAAAALLITCSILELIPAGTHISVWIMAIYASCGGILVCCLETQLKFVRTVIAMNFGFLFNSVYRFLFYCLMASVCWSYEGLLGYITSITLAVVAVFNTYVLCRYPSYRRMRENIAAEEDRRIQAKINQQVAKQAASNMGWGS